MLITPKELAELCDVARKHGATEFEAGDNFVRVKLGSVAVAPTEEKKDKQRPRANLLDKALSDDPLGE